MSTPPTEPVDLPNSLTYGKVMGRFLLPISDGPDEDRLPDGRPAIGLTITLTPETLLHRVADEGIPTATTVLRAPIEAVVGADGQVRAKEPGDADPGLWVVTGIYKVTYGGLSAWSRPPAHVIEVTEAHTETTPLDLTVAQDTPIPPGSPVTVLQVTGSPVVGYVVAVGADGTLTYAPAGEGGGLASYAQVQALADYPETFPPATHDHPDYLTAADLPPAPDLSDVVRTDDPRLSDPRTPTAHNHDGTYVKPADLPAPQTWDTLPGKPPVIAAGTSATAARDAIGAGTSNLQLGTGPTTAAAGNHTHDDRYYTESEVDAALAGKASTSHTHDAADLSGVVKTVNGTEPDEDGNVVVAGGGGGGVDWAWPQVSPAAPRIVGPPVDNSGNSGINGNTYVTCLLAPYGSITEVGVQVATGAAATLRLGLYGTDGNGMRAGDLLVDAGTVDASSAGWKVLTLATPVAWIGGPLWFAIYRMSTSTAAPQVPNAGQVPLATTRDHFNWASPTIGGGFYFTGQGYDAGLPATCPDPNGSYQPLRVGVKIA